MATLLDSDASLTDESLDETEIDFSDEDSPGAERILLPRNTEENTCLSHSPGESHNLNGQEHIAVYFDTIKKLKEEEHVKGTVKGGHVTSLTTYLEQQGDHSASKQFAFLVCTRLSAILDKSKHKQKLPSAIMGKVWGQFHKIRFDSTLHHQWTTYLAAVDVPPPLKIESSLTLQLLLDRLFKCLINILCIGSKPIRHRDQEVMLTPREQNAIRYMAGYIAVKLKKKYWKMTKNPELEKKRKMFVEVLTSMEAVDQVDGVDSVEDYSTMWTNLIDRGGLYHIKDEVYLLMESIEKVTGHHLNADTVQNSMGCSIQQLIVSEALTDVDILRKWELIALLPAKYEKYSIELLEAVVTLWTTVRCFVFAKGWNDHFQKKFVKHGTRKTLKNKDTEKETE